MTEPVPPIGAQISALAALAPDEPAVTCDGRTLTRGELDRSTNRLARAYAERGVGVGDYVTMVLPNWIEWIQAAVACWKLGAVPQPLSARLPDAELAGLLELRPPTLLVGREIACRNTKCASRFHSRPGVVRRGAARSGVAGLESDGVRRQHRSAQAHRIRRRQPHPRRHRLSARRARGRHHLGPGAAVAQHRFHHRDHRAADAPPPRADEPVRAGEVPPADQRLPRHLPDDGADHHAAGAAGLSRRTPMPTTCRRCAGSGTSARRARPPSSRPGSTCSVRRKSGNSTAAPNYRR